MKKSKLKVDHDFIEKSGPKDPGMGPGGDVKVALTVFFTVICAS